LLLDSSYSPSLFSLSILPFYSSSLFSLSILPIYSPSLFSRFATHLVNTVCV
jgi:hypothetical protein